jgi:hypothetical protein
MTHRLFTIIACVAIAAVAAFIIREFPKDWIKTVVFFTGLMITTIGFIMPFK